MRIPVIFPKNLFLLDGLGAGLSAGLLGAVLPVFEAQIGLPRLALHTLAIGAVGLAVYSLSCWWWLRRPPAPFLRAIAVANLTYCGLTVGLLIHFYPRPTWLGLAYFTGELLIVSGLAVIELHTAKTRAARASSK